MFHPYRIKTSTVLNSLLMSGLLFQNACALSQENTSKQTAAPEHTLIAEQAALRPIENDHAGRLVAIGDLHGDLDTTRRALMLAGAINSQDQWIGGNLTLVQLGDQLDRGDGEIEILELFEQLETAAKEQGGHVHVLNGNHEIMNAQGDLRYVTPKGFERFETLPNPVKQMAYSSQIPDFARPRLSAFAPGGPFALKLAQRQTVLQLGNILFAHGGLLPEHIDYGLDRINKEYSSWLQGRLPQLPTILTDDQSPIWTRIYSIPNQPADCARLEETLKKSGTQYLIVGHSVQSEINSSCNGQVWRIDTGMSKYYGGSVQVLEFNEGHFQVLKEHARTHRSG